MLDRAHNTQNNTQGTQGHTARANESLYAALDRLTPYFASTARRALGPSDGTDAIEEFMSVVAEHASRYDPVRSSAATYVSRLFRWHISSFVRRRTMHTTALQALAVTLTRRRAESIQGPLATVLAREEAERRAAMMREAIPTLLSRLTVRQRIILTSAVTGANYSRIARDIGVTPPTVAAEMRRIRAMATAVGLVTNADSR
jgi:RNA polymerase sigma factor (sigma-70 family)